MTQRSSYTPWVVDTVQASQLIEQGATILDCRDRLSWLMGHVPGAVHVNWKHFSQRHSPYKGKLLENLEVLEQKLRAAGVNPSKPVIVIGNPAHPCNFGEEGRIVWMLRTLGHPSAAFVDGGNTALIQAGVPMTLTLTRCIRGDFVVKRTNQWSIERDQLQAQLFKPTQFQNLRVIDTRSPREFAGATPYGEQRGGHIPGAIPFYFNELKDKDGTLLPRTQIVTKLNQFRIEYDTPVVTYCTGGIRSAFFVAVLADLGFSDIKNYAGSMWEWSVFPPDNYPLDKLE